MPEIRGAVSSGILVLAMLPGLCLAQGYIITTVAGGGAPITPAPAASVPVGVPSPVVGYSGDGGPP